MKFISLFLYNLSIQFYHSSIRVAALFNPKAKKWVEGRQNWESNLEEKLTFTEQPIWIHCASLGEFEQGRPLIEAFKKQHPESKILLSFYSPSGFEIRKNYQFADAVVYLPPDGRKNSQKFIEIVNPKMAIFVKYEFWYHYLNILKEEQIPTYLISAIFRKSQPFFRWYGSLHREMLRCFEHIFLQDKGSFGLLKMILPHPDSYRDKGEQNTGNRQISVKNKGDFSNALNDISHIGSPSKAGGKIRFSIAGDTRIDRVIAIQAENKPLPIIEQFCGENPNILICGSTWEADENLLIPLINNSLSNNYKTIIAPHEIKEAHVSDIQEKLTVPNITYSVAQKFGIGDAKVLIIDNIGMLAHLYRFGKIAYVGGGFGSGIHNTLEPIAFGLPVIFGRRFQKFPEAVTLIQNGGAFSIRNKEELTEVFKQLQEDNFYQNASEKAIAYLEENRGATKKILQQI